MAIDVLELNESLRSATSRRLLLIWQNPESRQFVRVGQLDYLVDGRFAFRYSREAVEDLGFFALDEYPDLDKLYVSDSLPVFFSNRVMSAERPSYAQYLGWLGLEEFEGTQIPFEVLVRTGGGRATDTFHVVEHPVIDGGVFSSRFFVSGTRHTPGADLRITALKMGDALFLRPDPENLHNPLAVLVDAEPGKAVGWVPDWICNEVSALQADGWVIQARAERVNADAPSHIKLLCRVDAVKQ